MARQKTKPVAELAKELRITTTDRLPGAPDDPFMATMKRGAEDAAKAFGEGNSGS